MQIIQHRAVLFATAFVLFPLAALAADHGDSPPTDSPFLGEPR